MQLICFELQFKQEQQSVISSVFLTELEIIYIYKCAYNTFSCCFVKNIWKIVENCFLTEVNFLKFSVLFPL